MNFRPRREEDIEINVTSLIDVVLLLLIFFMVSTRFIDESKINLTLPAASKEAGEHLPNVIDLTIDKRGQFFVNRKALVNGKISTIEQALRAAKPPKGDPIVVISVDRATQFQLAVDAMDGARHAGLYRITFPTAAREEE